MLNLTVEDSAVRDAEVEPGTIQRHRVNMTLPRNITHIESTSLSLTGAELAPGVNTEETPVLQVLLKQWFSRDNRCHLCLLENGFQDKGHGAECEGTSR